MVQVEYDKKADAMYIGVRKAKYDIIEELAENIIIDLDKNGRIIGIKVLGASKNPGQELIAKIINTEKQPQQSKRPANPPIKTQTKSRNLPI
jgi:uncharacterized protein YuzE